ncbi:hypothetical protein [Robertkochia sediminum]|uniref:hypothetical protein n=1 Tax=Robertkochia sediminum TaxID=2785326 RepID=UPI001931D817|nr:hypothetical protein [Robertkochia sediminum]MBL7472049.1 hypothetical protein [Robertkochia sediminum]
MRSIEELRESVFKMIGEMESDTDYSRSQEFLEEFWKKRNELYDEKYGSYGEEEKGVISDLINLLNRKGEENDMESW